MVSPRYDNLRHRIEKLEAKPTPRPSPADLDPRTRAVRKIFASMSPDECDKFLDSIMNKSRSLRKDTQ